MLLDDIELAIGAGSRNRTRDLLITNQLLYQLSYAGVLLRLGFALAIQVS